MVSVLVRVHNKDPDLGCADEAEVEGEEGPAVSWFVVLHNGRGSPLPMTEGDGDNIALFKTEDEAWKKLEENHVGAAFGGEVYEWPYEREK